VERRVEVQGDTPKKCECPVVHTEHVDVALDPV
jgi:hypothetical protein